MEDHIPDSRPDDLISAKEAGILAGKKKDTIRSWVRKGKLTGYRLTPNKPTSTLMVSTVELRVFLGTKATVTHPNNTGRPPLPTASLAAKDKEIENLKKELTIEQERRTSTQLRLQDFQTFHNTLKNSLRQRETELFSVRNQLKCAARSQNELLDKYHKSQDDYIKLSAYLSLPWWVKWNKNPPILEG
jgi:septal ring factor EnvC (AmiA/AmiB activator)